jgi:hypothetical protein
MCHVDDGSSHFYLGEKIIYDQVLTYFWKYQSLEISRFFFKKILLCTTLIRSCHKAATCFVDRISFRSVIW